MNQGDDEEESGGDSDGQDSQSGQEGPDAGGELLPGYAIHHTLVEPPNFGMPVRRTRSYSCMVRQGFVLDADVANIFRLFASCKADAGVFFGAPDEEATDRQLTHSL